VTIFLAPEPAIEEYHNASVCGAAYQATKALAEADNGIGQGVVAEGFIQFGAAGSDQWIAWHSKGQAHNEQTA
jgi:hypothetical protein